MSGVRRGWLLLVVLVATMAGGVNVAAGQIATTTVQDTVYSADGTPASGTVLVSWNEFTTASGESVAAGSTSATIGAGGVLTMSLAPNAGSTPMGTYYTAVFHLSDGTVSREYWVVPVTVPGGGPATLAAIKNQVLPASVAMQTVSKQYVDTAIAAAETGFPLDSSPYVLKAGDTMTGPLVLPADPVNTNQAADKHYVDTNVAALTAGLSQKVSTLPTATQVVAQPAGTQLEVNLLNGELYATGYLNGNGSYGISDALSSPDCAAGCEVVVDPKYTGGDGISPPGFATNPGETAVLDERGGAQTVSTLNPLGLAATAAWTESLSQTETQTVPQAKALRPGISSPTSHTLQLSMQALTGGSNQFPQNVETVPYFKSTYSTLTMTGNYYTQGQHDQSGNFVNCYAVGDCIGQGQYIMTMGGYRDEGDEGTHPADLFVQESPNVFEGSCTTGCSTGATSLMVTPTANGGTQGDGRFLIDTTPAKVLTTGNIIGGGKSSNATEYGTATFSGTSFPVSVFLQTAQAATSQAANIAPGTVTLAIATSGVPTGFATNTAALTSSSGVACVADTESTGPFPNFEMAVYQVVDGTHVQLTLNKVHATGSTIAVGGLCGYGLDQTIDDYAGIRQVFPVIGSYDATDLYYADATTSTIGRSLHTSGYVNVSLSVVSIARSANVVTVTTTGSEPGDLNGLSLTVSGVADSSYNGTFVVTTTGANTITYANTGANSTSSGGTVNLLTGAYALYPLAEVLSVYDAATGTVDGAFTLGANTVAWAAGDTVEQPHYYQQRTTLDIEYLTQYVPRGSAYVGAGKQYTGTVGPGLRGWQVANAAPVSQYLGQGGTHGVPDYAYMAVGPWSEDFDVEAGTKAVIWAHCNLNGCNRWDSTYALFQLDSAAGGGADSLNYQPQSSTATWTLGGAQYSYSPTSFTAGTINVGTLNATTITGGVSAGAITSGTISAARLPVFGPSGTTHAVGAVPDPGATAGATRYLREDGSWAVPAGGSGGSGTVTSFAAGTWPAWLTPTVTNAATTPTLAVAASAIPNTALASSATTVNGQSCALGGSCTITAPPATDIKYYPAAVCDGGTAYASGVTRYDNQQPQAGCLLPASSTAAYLAFNAGATLPQYASATIATPTYWTGTSLYLKFAGTATTGNVGWIVDTACTNDGSVISTATFGTPTTVTTTVSSTLGANVTTAVYSNVGVPGTNGCTAGTTIPGSLLTYRIHRSATDTQAGNANLLGVVLVTGRSQ